MLDEALETIHVDQNWYLSTYLDVERAIQSGGCASAKAHYKTFGYSEGRFPYEIKVNSKWYIEQYGDVASAIREGTFSDAQTHFDRDGYLEGRLPYAGFRLFGTAAEQRNGKLRPPTRSPRRLAKFLQPSNPVAGRQ